MPFGLEWWTENDFQFACFSSVVVNPQVVAALKRRFGRRCTTSSSPCGRICVCVWTPSTSQNNSCSRIHPSVQTVLKQVPFKEYNTGCSMCNAEWNDAEGRLCAGEEHTIIRTTRRERKIPPSRNRIRHSYSALGVLILRRFFEGLTSTFNGAHGTDIHKGRKWTCEFILFGPGPFSRSH